MLFFPYYILSNIYDKNLKLSLFHAGRKKYTSIFVDERGNVGEIRE